MKKAEELESGKAEELESHGKAEELKSQDKADELAGKGKADELEGQSKADELEEGKGEDDELDSQGSRPVVVPFEVADPDKPDGPEIDPDRERRHWPCADEEKDLCEAAAEVLEAAEERYKQASARHNARVQTAINRTRDKTDMPETNISTGEKFFAVQLKADRWEEVFENEVRRG